MFILHRIQCYRDDVIFWYSRFEKIIMENVEQRWDFPLRLRPVMIFTPPLNCSLFRHSRYLSLFTSISIIPNFLDISNKFRIQFTSNDRCNRLHIVFLINSMGFRKIPLIRVNNENGCGHPYFKVLSKGIPSDADPLGRRTVPQEVCPPSRHLHR